MILGIVGLCALFIFAAVMNASVSRAIKEDVFHGVTTGMCAGIALAITIVEAFKNRTPD